MEDLSKTIRLLFDRYDEMTVFEHILFCIMLIFMALITDNIILHIFPGLTLIFTVIFIFSTWIKIHHKNVVRKGYEEWEKEKYSYMDDNLFYRNNKKD